jgi:hypothetical protein
MEPIDETAVTNQAQLPNQSDCGGRIEARPISQPRCQRTIDTVGEFRKQRTYTLYPIEFKDFT